MKKLVPLILLAFLFIYYGCKKDQVLDCNQYSNDFTVDSTKISRKVIIIGIDGFRSDAMQQSICPFMYNLSLTNNVYYTPNHIVEGDTYSGPNWSSLLTGVHYDKHSVTDNSFVGSDYTQYPPFFNYIEKISPNINTASIVNWTPINEFTLPNSVDYAPQESMNDSIVFEKVKELLINSNPLSPDILFIHFDELDATGHTYGFSPFIEEYKSTLNRLDSYVNGIFNIIENKRLDGEDWICFIVSDHGGVGTSHGDANNPKVNKTIFYAQHPTVEFKANYTSNQTDLAATILDFLGISNPEFDCKTDGISIIK